MRMSPFCSHDSTESASPGRFRSPRAQVWVVKEAQCDFKRPALEVMRAADLSQGCISGMARQGRCQVFESRGASEHLLWLQRWGNVQAEGWKLLLACNDPTKRSQLKSPCRHRPCCSETERPVMCYCTAVYRDFIKGRLLELPVLQHLCASFMSPLNMHTDLAVVVQRPPFTL